MRSFWSKPEDSKTRSGGLFTIKKSTSKRFFQLSFEGFRPGGRNGFEQLLNSWGEFIRTLLVYLVKRVGLLFYLLSQVVLTAINIPKRTKTFVVAKLIWSRGRLGKPIVTSVVMGAALGVFSLGEIFSSSTMVVDQPISPDYLASTNDIIAKKEIALTTLPETRKRTELFVYKVSPGDSLFSIGEKFKISTDAIKYVNNLTDTSILSIGQDITIPPSAGLMHKVEDGDTLLSIADKYDVPAQAIADFNYLLDTSKLAVGTELVIPGGKVPRVVAQPLIIDPSGPSSFGSESSAEPNKSLCVWPTTVRIISQNFSWYHNGVDIATPIGGLPPLLACMNGVVVRAGWDPWGLGLHIRIDHGNGYETVYGHMSRLDVSYGQKVKRGQIIGLMGNTGRSTGAHVHYMVKYNGMAQNPLDFTR
jgi:murein DD-endopeptidase MepM/ murein hydrolase activator NlpD